MENYTNLKEILEKRSKETREKREEFLKRFRAMIEAKKAEASKESVEE